MWKTFFEAKLQTFFLNLKSLLQPPKIFPGITSAEIKVEGDKYVFSIICIAALKQNYTELDVKSPSIKVWELTAEEIKEM